MMGAVHLCCPGTSADTLLHNDIATKPEVGGLSTWGAGGGAIQP